MDIKQKILFSLFALQGIAWFFIGLAFAYYRGVYTIPALMFVNGLLFLAFAYNSRKKLKYLYYISAFYVSLNLILSITDEFGIFDLIFVCLNAVTIVFIWLTRKEYGYLPE